MRTPPVDYPATSKALLRNERDCSLMTSIMESKLPPRYEFRRKAVGSRQTFTAMDVDDDLVSEFSDGNVIGSLRENNGLVSIETGLELKSPEI
jgi:hypothetical protein